MARYAVVGRASRGSETDQSRAVLASERHWLSHRHPTSAAQSQDPPYPIHWSLAESAISHARDLQTVHLSLHILLSVGLRDRRREKRSVDRESRQWSEVRPSQPIGEHDLSQWAGTKERSR